jgi:hypothetical protein
MFVKGLSKIQNARWQLSDAQLSVHAVLTFWQNIEADVTVKQSRNSRLSDSRARSIASDGAGCGLS